MLGEVPVIQEDVGDKVIECQGDPVALVCCLNGMSDDTVISWQQFDPEASSWKPFTEDYNSTYYYAQRYVIIVDGYGYLPEFS